MRQGSRHFPPPAYFPPLPFPSLHFFSSLEAFSARDAYFERKCLGLEVLFLSPPLFGGVYDGSGATSESGLSPSLYVFSSTRAGNIQARTLSLFPLSFFFFGALFLSTPGLAVGGDGGQPPWCLPFLPPLFLFSPSSFFFLSLSSARARGKKKKFRALLFLMDPLFPTSGLFFPPDTPPPCKPGAREAKTTFSPFPLFETFSPLSSGIADRRSSRVVTRFSTLCLRDRGMRASHSRYFSTFFLFSRASRPALSQSRPELTQTLSFF